MFDERLQRYGTPLEPLEEDTVPSKKPIRIEDQIVTDENGRRRFHGAFTGGFSAGFWNTVGSQEGWTPQSFKSSRGEKAPQRTVQKPEDFMDDEDMGEFGIAPQRIKPQKDFAVDTKDDENRKRKLMPASSGPIPGMPVLEQLLKPTHDKLAVRILKSMGWRPGQGIGPRQTRKERKTRRAYNKREMYLMQQYGCELGQGSSKTVPLDDEESDKSTNSDEDDSDGITFAPDDFDSFVCTPKDNRFGLGYTGLSREPVLSKGTTTVNKPNTIYQIMKDKKKLSITGQAFGVGALEEEDDDIYANEDMSGYDFSLDDKKPKQKAIKHVQQQGVLEGFVEAKQKYQVNKIFKVDMPPDFVPRDWAVRKSRFEPLDPTKEKELNLRKDIIKLGLGRHDLDPMERGQILGEPPPALLDDRASTSNEGAAHSPQSTQSQSPAKKPSNAERSKALLEKILGKSNNFTKGGIITTDGEEKPSVEFDKEVQEERKDLLEKASKKTQGMAKIGETFKPFLGNDAKQTRYEKFLDAKLQDENEIRKFLNGIQPMHLSEWDREMEQKEFIQARSIYKPLEGLMSDRFITETAVGEEKVIPTEPEQEKPKEIEMQRTKTMWKPSSLLCKRYNIPEPFGGTMVDNKKQSKSKAKLSVFDYLEASINTKANFKTPVIIPKNIERPRPMVDNRVYPMAGAIANKVVTETSISSTSAQSNPTVEPAKVSNESETKSKHFKPKTDLERRVDESRDKPPEEKIDLYKAIFEDTDEDEPEDESANLIEQLMPASVPKPTTASAANILRNTSAPKGIFEALFASAPVAPSTAVAPAPAPAPEKTVDKKVVSETSIKLPPPPTQTPTKILFNPKLKRKIAPETADDAVASGNLYGPQIPENLQPSSEMPEKTSDVQLNLKLLSYLNKQREKFGREDEWVEKTTSTSKKGHRHRNSSTSSRSGTSDTDSHDSDSRIEVRRRKKKVKNSKKKKSKAHERKKKDKKNERNKSEKQKKSSKKKKKIK